VPDNIIESLLSSVRSRFDQAGDQSPPRAFSSSVASSFETALRASSGWGSC